MLAEIKKVRQIEGEPARRWFNCHQMDLFIWYENNQIIGFQLCYDKDIKEKAFSWHKDRGLQHQKVDDGENRPGHYKATPILVQNGSYELISIIEEFKKYSLDLIDEIKDFVLKKLKEVEKT